MLECLGTQGNLKRCLRPAPLSLPNILYNLLIYSLFYVSDLLSGLKSRVEIRVEMAPDTCFAEVNLCRSDVDKRTTPPRTTPSSSDRLARFVHSVLYGNGGMTPLGTGAESVSSSAPR